MGLDMYLSKRTYVGNKYKKPGELLKVEIPKAGTRLEDLEKIKNKRIQYVIEDVGYWRKDNQIHAWFVENVQGGEDDCKEYPVSGSQLKELLETCEDVLKASKLVKGKIIDGYTYENNQKVPIEVDGKFIKDPTVAKELLPVREGFFFGGKEYDEYYLQGVKETIKLLEKLLKEDPNGEYYYSSSW